MGSQEPVREAERLLAQCYDDMRRVARRILSGDGLWVSIQDALRSLDRAGALLAQSREAGPLRADFLAEQGWVHLDRWLLQPDSAASARENRQAREQLMTARALAPGSEAVALGLLVADKNDAYDMIWAMDDAPRAGAMARAALARLDRHEWTDALADTAAKLRIELLSLIGETAYQADDLPAALAAYQAADRLIDAQIARHGDLPNLLILKGQNAFDLSGTLGDMAGRQEEALRIARAGAAALRAMLAQGPDAAAEKKLLVLYGQEALLLSGLGRAGDALVPLRASVALRDHRLAGAPDDPQRMRELAIGLGAHVDRLGEAGLAVEACAAARRTVALWGRIKALGRLGALDARKNVPRSAERVRMHCEVSGG